MKDILIILLICTFSIQLWMGETAQFPNANDASGLLRRSEGADALALGIHSRGHARNHVVGRVEDYSRGSDDLKTAFEDDVDQNEVMRRMINSDVGRDAIDELNRPNTRKSEPYFRLRDLQYNYRDRPAPYVRRFRDGNQVGARVRMVGAKLVLAHRQDRTPEVLVLTMFPVAPRL